MPTSLEVLRAEIRMVSPIDQLIPNDSDWQRLCKTLKATPAAVRDEARQGIRVYSPNGQEIAYIPTPEKPTLLAFGRDRTTLYITAGRSLYRVQIQ